MPPVNGFQDERLNRHLRKTVGAPSVLARVVADLEGYCRQPIQAIAERYWTSPMAPADQRPESLLEFYKTSDRYLYESTMTEGYADHQRMTRMVVAAGLKVVLHRPLATQAKLVSRPRVKEVVDLGADSAAIILSTRELTTPDGDKVATVDNSTLARKHGGFGGKVTQAPQPHAVPTGAPQIVCELPTPTNLALLYRLNGDENPLHVEPDLARKVGFERPILHGAASFGIAAHAVLRQIDYRADMLHSIEARFARPVFPGDTLRTEIWRDGAHISFQCRAAGCDDIVLGNGLAVLRD